MATFSAAGFYGKIPAQADFVRLRAADAVARPLVMWLEEGSEAAKRAGVPSGSEPVRFMFRPAGAARGLLGVIVSSADKVGRRFPLALFAPVEGPDLGSAFPVLPRAATTFLDAATALAREATGIAVADLASRVERLPLPEAADVAAAAAEAAAFAASDPGPSWLGRLFGDAATGQRLYALHCFRSACRAVRGQEPAGAGVVLECPVRGDVDRWAWLELARRGLDWNAPPTFFWSERAESRVLLSLGSPPASVLGVLWRADGRDARVWRLVTEKPAAITAAQRALGARVVEAVDRDDLSLGELFDVVMP